MFQLIGKLLKTIRAWRQNDSEVWLIIHRSERLYLACVMNTGDDTIMMERWVSNPARAYRFTLHQKTLIEKGGQIPENGCWAQTFDVPKSRHSWPVY
jgi:hypothetical protein